MISPLILAAAIALTGSEGEHLVIPPHDGFVIGNEGTDQFGTSLREEVPKGETVQDWSRMVTSVRHAGLASQITVYDYAATLGARLAAQCPGAQIQGPTISFMAGFAAARLEITCPKLPDTGKSELMLMLAVGSVQDVLAAQVAFRGGHTAEQVKWARTLLDNTQLCLATDASAPCRVN